MKKVYFMLLCAASVALVGCNNNAPEDPSTPEEPSTPVTEKKAALAKVAFEAGTVKGAISVMNRQTEDGKMTFAYEKEYPVAGMKLTGHIRYYGCGEDTIRITYYVADGQSADSLTSVEYTNTAAGNTLKTTGLANLDSIGANPTVCGVARPFNYGTTSNLTGQQKDYKTFRDNGVAKLGGKGSEEFFGLWKDANNQVNITLRDQYVPSSNSKSLLKLRYVFTSRDYVG